VGTPTAGDFAAVDMVVTVGNTCNGGYTDAALFGNRLATYVDHGGVVLQTAYDNWDEVGSYPTGRFASGGYPPLGLGPNDNEPTALGQILQPSSPIVQGLGTFPSMYNTTTPLAPGATLLAKWADGRNAIAMKGRVVAVSASPADGSSYPSLPILARNTVKYFTATPNTKISRVTVNSGRGLAAFRFMAVGYSTGFKCELKKVGTRATFKGCSSPKRYTSLAPGSYVFKVAAVGLKGPDPTPATKGFVIRP
jgi:hypothetical protein